MKLNKARFGVIGVLTLLFWLKSIFAYYTKFNLGNYLPVQHAASLLNPIVTCSFLFGIGLLILNGKWFSRYLMVLYTVISLLLMANVVYYREFSTYISVSTMMSVTSVNENLIPAAMETFNLSDILFLIDIPILIKFLVVKKINLNEKLRYIPVSFLVQFLSLAQLFGLFYMSPWVSPGMFVGGYDNREYVRAFGVVPFTIIDLASERMNAKVQETATQEDYDEVVSYIQDKKVPIDEDTFGIAKGRNVVFIHLESIHQFLIGLEVAHEGEMLEVTPVLNSIFNSKDSISFDNFFQQTGTGRTSDAEILIENSLYGLNSGSAMVTLGERNSWYTGSHILNQTNGYRSAVFHDNTPSFFKRGDVYRSFGYDHFFHKDFYDSDYDFGFGILDAQLFEDGYGYYKQMESPKVGKFIMVTNHTPYDVSDFHDFPVIGNKTDVVGRYLSSVNYSDSTLQVLLDNVEADNEMENTIFVFYGDHQGLSDDTYAGLEPVIGQALNGSYTNEFTYDSMSRVPLMFYIPGSNVGEEINHTYGGQIDVMPTLLRLLGDSSDEYIHLGQDLLSTENDNTVLTRYGTVINKQYLVTINNIVYNMETGKTATLSKQKHKKVIDNALRHRKDLEVSDKILDYNLLRFFEHEVVNPVSPTDYNYADH